MDKTTILSIILSLFILFEIWDFFRRRKRQKSNQKEESTNKENQSSGQIIYERINLSMNINCKCGRQSYIDGSSICFVECPECGTIYKLDRHIKLEQRDIIQCEGDIHIAS